MDLAEEGVDLRRAIIAPPRHVLAVVDYSQIESRVLLFLAGAAAIAGGPGSGAAARIGTRVVTSFCTIRQLVVGVRTVWVSGTNR